MASDVSIANQALLALGEGPITSLNDNTKPAKAVKAIYADVRDAVLQESSWTFAIGRFSPAASATPPLHGFANAFPLDSNVLRVLGIGTDDAEWDVEGRSVVTDEAAVRITAVVRVSDPSTFSPLFVQAFAARLAADLAIVITKSHKMRETQWAVYESKLAEASAMDGTQRKSKRLRSRWLTDARFRDGVVVAGPVV